jgi:pilus assembly protein CpaB
MKSISRRTVFLAAVCAGLLAALLVFLFIDAQKTRAAQMVERVPVVVAARDIAARTVIEPDMIRVERRTAVQLPSNSLSSVEQARGKVALEMIGAGDPVVGTSVAARNASLGLAYVVRPDMRAVTVALDPIIGVAGFLKPGDHVDVLATFVVDDISVTKTVLQNVELLALGPEALPTEVKSKAGQNSEARQQPNATLSVTPEQAEKLILAESRGKLRLSLRSVGDDVKVALHGVNTVSLIGIAPKSGSSYAAPAVRERPPVSSVGYTSPAFYGGMRPFFDKPRVPALGVASAFEGVAGGKEVEVVRGTEKTVVRVSE